MASLCGSLALELPAWMLCENDLLKSYNMYQHVLFKTKKTGNATNSKHHKHPS